jgi:hypothetical protein
MTVGDEYVYIDSQVKILMFDNNEVFYTYIDADKSDFTKYKTVSYYRTTSDHFTKNATYIRSSEFNKNFTSIHRPDLPLKLNCFKNIFWSPEKIDNLNDFKILLNDKGISQTEFTNLNINKVVIFPQGQQLSTKKSTILETDNEVFSGLELIYQCFQIQREHVNIKKPYFSRFRLIQVGREEKRLSGIGLYRLGIKNNVPSYYLGGYLSSLELESEDSLII